jgi:hypothetical protein
MWPDSAGFAQSTIRIATTLVSGSDALEMEEDASMVSTNGIGLMPSSAGSETSAQFNISTAMSRVLA